MDSRGKQRLTGAVILVALFVLLVPELLTGPRNAGGDAPSEEGMRRYTIDLDAPTSGTQPTAPANPAPAVSLPPVAESARDARAVPGEAAQPETPAPATSAAPAPTPVPSVVTPMAAPPQSAVAATPAPATSAPKPASTTPPKPATNPAPTPTTVRTETPKPAPTSPAANTRGGFAVQLGSFVSRENAERLVREMNAKGFNAFLAPPIQSGGRELYRVRVGPTRDRASAEALATQLRRIGQNGSIVSNS